MTPLAAYALLFLAVGVGFIFVHLLAGYFIRPQKPDAEKGTIYECGEPTIGSAWIQFDLRFYVVALLFVIFDVEVAFFFPWAEVFGKANAIATTPKPTNAAEYKDYADKVLDLASGTGLSKDDRDILARHRLEREKRRNGEVVDRPATDPTTHLSPGARSIDRLEELQMLSPEEAAKPDPAGFTESGFRETRSSASSLAWMALLELLAFFGILLVGFAYLWRRGDLNWVRSTAAEEQASAPPPAPAPVPTPAPRVHPAGTRDMATAGHH